MAVTNKRRKIEQRKSRESTVLPPDTLAPSQHSEQLHVRDRGTSTSPARLRKDKHLQTSSAPQPTAQWSPTRNGFLAVPRDLRSKPKVPRRNLATYTQYLDSLAGDVDEKWERSVATANGVTNLDWRVKEVSDDGSSHESQLHRSDDSDNGARATSPKDTERSSTTASSTGEDQAA